MTTHSEWKNLHYLRCGTARQQAAYHALQSLGVFHTLRELDPLLVGTIPIDVDIPGSDLDIICEAWDLDTFYNVLVPRYSVYREFHAQHKALSRVPSVIARFLYDDFPIEIVGQPRPVAEQHAFRHMVVEARLLRFASKQVREVIRGLKRTGMKTEPAFAHCFAISADPYHTLLEWFAFSDAELQRAIELNENS